MKVLLVRPPYPYGKQPFISKMTPLNLLYLASYLQRNNVEVKVLDMEVEQINLNNYIKEFRPEIAGFTSCTPTLKSADNIAKMVKKILPDTMTVLGGVHPTALPAETLNEFSSFDIIVHGEGEETLLEICKKYNTSEIYNINGIAYRVNGDIRVNPPRPLIKNLDELPFPARDLINLDRYKGQIAKGHTRDSYRLTEIITSRGCPKHCIFCATHIINRGGVRFRSAENVLNEIEECISNYKVNAFVFLDDTFVLPNKRFFTILDGIKKFKVKWGATAVANTISKDLLLQMKEAGCAGLLIGVESGSQRILDLIKKGITVDQVKKAFAIAKEAGIGTEADFIIGSHPSETIEDVEKTISLIKEIDPDILSVTILTPYPGTESFRLLEEKNYIFEKNWEKFYIFGEKPCWRTDNFSPEELVKLQKKILRSFYLSPRKIYKNLKNINDIKTLFYYLNAGMRFLNKILF